MVKWGLKSFVSIGSIPHSSAKVAVTVSGNQWYCTFQWWFYVEKLSTDSNFISAKYYTCEPHDHWSTNVNSTANTFNYYFQCYWMFSRWSFSTGVIGACKLTDKFHLHLQSHFHLTMVSCVKPISRIGSAATIAKKDCRPTCYVFQRIKNWSSSDLRKDYAVSEVAESVDFEVKLTRRHLIPQLPSTTVQCLFCPGSNSNC